MSKDRVELGGNSQNLKEVYYAGEDVSDLLKTIKLTTIRRSAPKYQGFEPGQTIRAVCEGLKESVSLVIWGVQENIPFGEIDSAILALDGYFDLISAVTEMRTYPGYGDTDLDTPMTVIATIHTDRLWMLRPDRQMALLDQVHGRSISEVIRNPILTPFFKPIIEKWLDIKKERLLRDLGLLTP